MEPLRHNYKGILKGFDDKTWGDTCAQVRGVLTAIWKDKQDMHILTNVYQPTAKANLCDRSGIGHKPANVEDCSHCINRRERMANSYSVSQGTWK
jgi:hypothetical protein